MTRRQKIWIASLATAGAAVAVASWWSFTTTGNGTLHGQKPEVLLVFGSPADISGAILPMQLWRVHEAVAEYRRGAAPFILFSGGATARQFVEADVMAAEAEREGVPQSAIVRERTSTTTVENIRDFTPILLAHGWRRAELISSADHLPRIAVLMRGSPLEWSLHAAPTPGRNPIATGIGYAEEAFATLVLRLFGRHAEPLLHAAATCVHAITFAPRWLLWKLGWLRRR